ncbi:hypothetical protein [Sphingomonas sp. SAFR-052]|uniref:hypothetical protein n=1 Tax=Sphingomonas sp. SAFR-052 TaxID=3436867 RepID=UPI003F823065
MTQDLSAAGFNRHVVDPAFVDDVTLFQTLDRFECDARIEDVSKTGEMVERRRRTPREPDIGSFDIAALPP